VLSAYLDQTRTFASSLSHAWDLSLLIKPVQRLLKYSLLLGAVIADTPAHHPDKPNLVLVKKKMEEVVEAVNEGQRRREVVKDMLTKSTGDAQEEDHRGRLGGREHRESRADQVPLVF
jgi:dynamin-binding protein